MEKRTKKKFLNISMYDVISYEFPWISSEKSIDVVTDNILFSIKHEDGKSRENGEEDTMKDNTFTVDDFHIKEEN